MKRTAKKLFTLLLAILIFATFTFPVYAAKNKNPQHAYYGIVNEQGIECSKQGFTLILPDDFEIENRGEITLNGSTYEYDPNDPDKTFAALDIELHEGTKIFRANNGNDYISIYVEDPGDYDKWNSLLVVSNSAYKSTINSMSEDPYYENVSGEAAKWSDFCGKKFISNFYYAENEGDPYYRQVIYILSYDNKYLTTVYLSCWYENDLDTLRSYFSELN